MRIYQEKNKQRNAILLQFSLLTDLVPSLGQPNGNYVKTVRNRSESPDLLCAAKFI